MPPEGGADVGGRRPVKVLVVVESFPATGGSRVDKFVRLLPEFGVEPIVLAPEETDSPTARRMQAELYPPGLKVQRAHSLGWSYFTSRYLSRGPGSRHYELLRLLSYPERLLFLPDHMVRWIPLGIRRAGEIVAREGIRVVLTSSPPESTHLIGLRLHDRLGLRWIADFRDLWTEKTMLFRPASRWHDRTVRGLEKRVFATADHIVANTPHNLERYRRRFALPDSRVTMIPNGFDPRDAEMLPPPPPQPSETMHIAYAGNMDKHGLPWRSFLEAVDRLADEVGRRRVRLESCGYFSSEVSDFVRNRHMEDVFAHHGELSHGDAMRVVAGCDVLVALLYEDTDYSDSIVPLKLYNYLMMRRPILFVGPEHGAGATVMRETRAGDVVPPVRGADGILEWLRGAFERWSRGELAIHPDETAIARYDSREQTRRLAAIIRGE